MPRRAKAADEAPCTPAADLVNLVAPLALDVAPFEEGGVDRRGEAGHVKDVSEGGEAGFVREMRGGEGGDDGDAGGERTEVNHVDIVHKVVGPTAADPASHVLGIIPEVVWERVNMR